MHRIAARSDARSEGHKLALTCTRARVPGWNRCASAPGMQLSREASGRLRRSTLLRGEGVCCVRWLQPPAVLNMSCEGTAACGISNTCCEPSVTAIAPAAALRLTERRGGQICGAGDSVCTLYACGGAALDTDLRHGGELIHVLHLPLWKLAQICGTTRTADTCLWNLETP